MSKNMIVNIVKSLMDSVYGEYLDENWKPKSFDNSSGRYLFTDAIAVINYLSLFEYTQDEVYLSQAKILVSEVHDVLGKTRDLNKRLTPATDEHPLLGGLRIGKLNSEGPEMNQDGQYYVYLLKWMFALNRLSVFSNDLYYNSLAIELVESIHPYFIKSRANNIDYICFKLSIDLKRPLIANEGNLDAFAGLHVYMLLRETSNDPTVLKTEILQLYSMVKLRTPYVDVSDIFDIGEALWISSWHSDELWAQTIRARALKALESAFDLHMSTPRPLRLAFRELVSTAGVQCLEDSSYLNTEWYLKVEKMHLFWNDFLYIKDSDITPVMFCLSLFPGIYRPSR